MLWLITSCRSNYSNISKIQKDYEVAKIICFPTRENIISSFLSQEVKGEKCAILAPYWPPEDLKSLFVIQYLQNHKNDILTQQEQEYNVKREEALYQKLGIRVKKSLMNFSNLGGYSKFKEWSKDMILARENGFNVKAAFTLGVSGVGKTYGVECLAGELDRPIVYMNLPYLQHKQNSIENLIRIYDFLEKSKIPVIILKDEVEKMFDYTSSISKQFMGQLLTIQNDLGKKDGYNIDAITFDTSNSIMEILKHNPEYLRYGRWSAKFFVNYPHETDAMDIYELYSKKYDLDLDILDLYSEANTEYYQTNLQSMENRSVYSAAEIEALMERIAFKKFSGDKDMKEIIDEAIKTIKPQQLTASDAIARMITEKNLGFEEI